MSELLREVDEQMQQERMQALWKEYGPYIIAFVLGTILLTGAMSFYRSWDAGVKEKQTAAFTMLKEDASYPDNLAALEDIDFRGGLRGIALLDAAGTYMSQDKTEDALTLYTRAAEDSGIPNEFRYLAILQKTRLESGAEGADGKALLAALKPVLNDNGSPWQQHARLEAAVINANFLDDYAAARALLNDVRMTENLPESLYAKASALDHVYTGRQNKQEAKNEKTN